MDAANLAAFSTGAAEPNIVGYASLVFSILVVVKLLYVYYCLELNQNNLENLVN